MARYGVNMSRIESRPSRRKKWEYVFFVDVDGHVEDDSIAKAFSEMESNSSLFRILGAYPKAVL